MAQYDRSSSFISQNPRRSILLKQSFIIDDESFTIDILTVGEWNVGKTSIIRAYIDGTINQNVKCISTSSLTKYEKQLDGQNQPKVKILDTPGKPIYFPDFEEQLKGKNFQAVVFVFDLSNKSSFEKVEQWSKKINVGHSLKTFLIGNKCDLKRVIQPEEAIEMAKKLGTYAYYESSIKINENLYPEIYSINTFYEIVDDIIRALNDQDEKCESPKTIIYKQINNQPINQQKKIQSQPSQSLKSSNESKQVSQQDHQNKKPSPSANKQKKSGKNPQPIMQQTMKNNNKQTNKKQKNTKQNESSCDCAVI